MRRGRGASAGTLARFAGALRPGVAPDADLLARDLQAATDRARRSGRP